MPETYDLNKGFIEEVRAASDIVKIIGRHVALKKRGKNFLGLCPFHNEKTPSFTVGPDRQMYYCFGCGANGDVFRFLMDHEKLSFPDAVVELAREQGIKVPLKTAAQGAMEAEKTRMVDANEAALAFYRNELKKPGNEAVTDYLKNRGISEELIERFAIGYAPDSFDALQNAIGQTYGAKIMETTGIIQQSSTGQGYIDRFRKRIIIPIHSAGGRLIAFGGRIFGDGEPKFINSPETPLFHKSRTLYGLNLGLRSIRKQGFAIIVEGYFDVAIMHMFGFENTVAPLGTSLTEEHAHALYRYCKKVIICMDADEAGRKAAIRSAGIMLSRGFAVNVLPLPAGEDPDSFLQKNGKDALKDLLRNSEPAYKYVLSVTVANFDLTRPTQQRAALNELVPMLDRINDPIERSHSIGETADALGIEQHIVVSALNQNKDKNFGKNEKTSAESNWLTAAEKELLLSSVYNAKKCKKYVEEFEIIDYLSPFVRKMVRIAWWDEKQDTSKTFQRLAEATQDEEEKRLVAELAIYEEERIALDDQQISRIVISIAMRGIRKEISELRSKMEELQLRDPASPEIDVLYSRNLDLSAKLYELDKSILLN